MITRERTLGTPVFLTWHPARCPVSVRALPREWGPRDKDVEHLRLGNLSLPYPARAVDAAHRCCNGTCGLKPPCPFPRFIKGLQKAAEFSGVAGEFRCYSLHRSQISKDL